MDLPVALVPGFSQAAAALRKIRPVAYRTAADDLASLDQVLRAAQILIALKPGEIDKYHPEGGWLKGEDGFYDLGDAVAYAINEIAPLDMEAIDMDLQDGYFRMIPESRGRPMNWDSWDEMVNDPENYLYGNESAWAFCAALGVGDQAAFEAFSEYYDWELSYPRKAGGAYDKAKFFKALERRGLGCFKAIWSIATYSTDNLYFDYNIYDDNMDLPPFSLEGVREMERAYRAALPIEAEARWAQDLFESQPGLPAALLRIYVRSLVKDEKPRTLVEVFRAERERGHAAENDVTDPLGVLDREEDEDGEYVQDDEN